MYKVVRAFRDAKNEDHYYGVGDIYPVAGYKPTKTRIEELEKGKNKCGKVFIEEVKEENPSETPQTSADVNNAPSEENNAPSEE